MEPNVVVADSNQEEMKRYKLSINDVYSAN